MFSLSGAPVKLLIKDFIDIMDEKQTIDVIGYVYSEEIASGLYRVHSKSALGQVAMGLEFSGC